MFVEKLYVGMYAFLLAPRLNLFIGIVHLFCKKTVLIIGICIGINLEIIIIIRIYIIFSNL